MATFRNLDIESHETKWLQAVGVFEEGDLAGALFLFKKLAHEGCAPALIEIGNIYELGGGGVKQDLEIAKRWYRYAVDIIDDARAHLALGRLYLQTGTSNSDFSKARFHLNNLIEHNCHRGAYFGLGMIYHFGLGVSRDLEKAEEFYILAVEQGHVLALRNLASIRFRQSKLAATRMWVTACCKTLKIALFKPSDRDSRRRLGIL